MITVSILLTFMVAGGAIALNIAAVTQLHLGLDSKTAYASRSDDETVPYLAGVRAFAAGQFDRALALFSKSPTRGELSDWFVLQSLDANGQWREVLEQLDPDSPQESELFAGIFVEHEGEMSPTERDRYMAVLSEKPASVISYIHNLMSARRFSEAVSVAQGVTAPEWRNAAMLLEARGHFYLQEYDMARQILTDLLEVGNSSNVVYWLGRTRYEQGEVTAGLEDVAVAAKELSPLLGPEYLLTYVSMLERAGQCTLALETLADAIGDERYHSFQGRLIDALDVLNERC